MSKVLPFAARVLLLSASALPAQPSPPPPPRTAQAVPFIVNGGQCEDECDEYMSRQLMGTFARTVHDCNTTNRFYVYGNQVGVETGAALMITSSRLQRSEDGNSMLMFLTGSVSDPANKSGDDKSGTASLEYNMETNRLTVSSADLSLPKTAFLRCRVPLPPRYGEY